MGKLFKTVILAAILAQRNSAICHTRWVYALHWLLCLIFKTDFGFNLQIFLGACTIKELLPRNQQTIQKS
ncbi:hypothetical protein CEN50_16770 [Fischerella thermalis CCMEE 5268]|uniref:Uncharacterized protein n=1 Tax=Fischerella thermalis CCMEE 5268 TaxID=2019662 RepID=A0A2N6KDK7_9CYAN|nr:hypothetical protein CEN50_16770 [Fischerella thermalis CCMEE 5268]